MFRQSIRTNIILVFLLLLSCISFALIYTQYYFNSQLAVKTTTKTFELVGKNILDEVKKENTKLENILHANMFNASFQQNISFTSVHPAAHDLIRILSTNPGLYSMYIAQKDGSFYEVINMKESLDLYKYYKAPQETRWLIISSKNDKIEYAFLNKAHKKIASRSTDTKYTPLDSIWYKAAVSSPDVIITKPYIFNSLKKIGTTYALETEQKGTVIAIDYSMESLNSYFYMQIVDENSELFLFNKNGQKLASSSAKRNDTGEFTYSSISPHMQESLLKNKQKTLKYTENNRTYLAMYLPLDGEFYLGIEVDTQKLFAPYKESMTYSLIISFLLLLLSLPIILFAVNLIVKPIRALIEENKEIKERRFNAVNRVDTNIIEFIELSESQVSMSHNIAQYQKSQEEMLDAIVKLIAEAVDKKSPYTGGHCKRVPEIAQMLVSKASSSREGVFKEFQLEDKEALREFEIGAWLHDCGKVTTPEYVVDKSTKLETINDRIHEVRTRFEVLWRDAQISYLEAKLAGDDVKIALEILQTQQKQLIEEFEFIASANIGGEYMSSQKQEKIHKIASKEWVRHFDDRLGIGAEELQRYENRDQEKLPVVEKLLSDKKQHLIKREYFDYEAYKEDGFKEEVPEYLYNHGEVYNLCIAKGTLSIEERYKINEHVIMTIKMLEKIPFPSGMSKIPEYAGTHHETLIGTGYPRKLTKKDLSIPARIMALADVFEALTASDRPYKKAKTLSESVEILFFMVKDEHLDADVFRLFLESDLHNVYAKMYLKPEQIDKVDIKKYL